MSYKENTKEIDIVYQSKENNTPSQEFIYVVPMFPYPSENIHMGHVRNYTITNVITNYLRLKGKSVIHPIGFDAFGLPAENAAIKHQKSPNEWTENNIAKMKSNFTDMGFDFDWSTCTQTNHPDYYRFEQEIFRKSYKAGVIYKKSQYVNFDPVDKTVLSNEQVINGKGWRTGADVIRKKMPMYFFNMKKYAKELYDGLNDLKKWPKDVIEMQRKWINYQTGEYFRYDINDNQIDVFKGKNEDNCIIIGINHAFVETYKNNDMDFQNWLNENEKGSVSQKDSFKKETMFDTGLYTLINQKKYPIFIDMNMEDECYFTKRKMTGMFSKEIKAINSYQGEFIGLKDWCISRQRYWGAPIPMINCQDCGDVVDENFVELPNHLIPDVGNALEKEKSFMKCVCSSCGKEAFRCSDTMDTFVQSSWYYHYYITKFFGAHHGIIKKETQIDYYVGGIEHATMHLIYTRFFHKVLRDFNYVSTDEPIKKLITQGMVCKKYINQEGKQVSAKMSKSLGNIVEPADYIEKYGSDALQMFIMFAAPPNQSFDFDDAGIIGCHRFLDDVYRYYFEENKAEKIYSEDKCQETMKKMQIEFDKEFETRFNMNTLISKLMITFKMMKKTNFINQNIKYDCENIFIKYLEVFAPKISFFIKKNIF